MMTLGGGAPKSPKREKSPARGPTDAELATFEERSLLAFHVQRAWGRYHTTEQPDGTEPIANEQMLDRFDELKGELLRAELVQSKVDLFDELAAAARRSAFLSALLLRADSLVDVLVHDLILYGPHSRPDGTEKFERLSRTDRLEYRQTMLALVGSALSHSEFLPDAELWLVRGGARWRDISELVGVLCGLIHADDFAKSRHKPTAFRLYATWAHVVHELHWLSEKLRIRPQSSGRVHATATSHVIWHEHAADIVNALVEAFRFLVGRPDAPARAHQLYYLSSVLDLCTRSGEVAISDEHMLPVHDPAFMTRIHSTKRVMSDLTIAHITNFKVVLKRQVQQERQLGSSSRPAFAPSSAQSRKFRSAVKRLGIVNVASPTMFSRTMPTPATRGAEPDPFERSTPGPVSVSAKLSDSQHFAPLNLEERLNSADF